MIDSNTNGDIETAAANKCQGDNGPSSDATSMLQPTPLPFETLMDALPCPVYYQDTQGVFLGYNKSFSNQILDKSVPCLIGKSVADCKGSIPDDLAAFSMVKDTDLADRTDAQVYEAPVRCGDGKIRHFAFHK
jgi:PAS domain-containing protein